jgi:SAM-dependent methyltransferase
MTMGGFATATARDDGPDSGLEHLLPLMRAKGVTAGPREFQETVNLVFHNFESSVYDRIHRDLRESLPRHFHALIEDWLRVSEIRRPIRVLDIGCGTGASTELLLATAIGGRVEHVDLLDTSAEMLSRCGERESIRRVSHRLIRGTLDALPAHPAYDLILACSVLHHIPSLREFLSQLVRLQTDGGAFLHLQDPNGDYLQDGRLLERMDLLAQRTRRHAAQWAKRLTPRRVARRLWNSVSGKKNKSYIDLANDELIRRGLIAEPLSGTELWQVTDIHVYDGKGISVEELRSHLGSHELLAMRAYSFFGAMHSDLPAALKQEEDRLIEERALNGMHVGAIWRKRSAPPVSEPDGGSLQA